jgi:uncharacterized protein YdhG (YjbR/CyaY superfamily)
MTSTASGDRSAHFPAIEKKHGQPISHWLEMMKEIADRKYPEQIAYLRENHGFSQAHANAVVLYAKGNTSSKRFHTVSDYAATLTAEQQAGLHNILNFIKKTFPKTEATIAWNQPQVKLGEDFIIGMSVSKNHITIGPWLEDFVSQYKDRLSDYKHGTKTFQVPLDWSIDKKLMKDIIQDRINELKS